MKKYAAIFNFVPRFNEQVLISAENEEQALMTLYFAAHEACSWPKEKVTVKGIWSVGDIPGSVTDTLKQKRNEKKYPYYFIHRQRRSGQIYGCGSYGPSMRGTWP